MTKEPKDYGKSVKAKLLNLSKTERISYQLLLIRYVHERLLYRLAQSKYKNSFYLKGGALLYAHEQLKARPTLDIDFLGSNINNDRKIIKRPSPKYVPYPVRKTESFSIQVSSKRKISMKTGSIKAYDCI